NGVHVHFSLRRDGEPVNYCEGGPGGMSKELASFCAGVLFHCGLVAALSSPSVISYERLKPHHWSAAYRCIGMQNREAAIRVCPVPPGESSREFLHAELRIGDATASPYMHMGSIVHAGLDGIENGIDLPAFVERDPADLAPDELTGLGIKELPQSLKQALTELEANEVFRNSASPLFWECYFDMKETERNYVERHDLDEQIRMYMGIY
ncbi:MAG: glutamine synthetase, partial [Albidovulum sp.]|nr:glutamine synthetase [Albidovulum sp.]